MYLCIEERTDDIEILRPIPPWIPREYWGRCSSIMYLRARIKAIHTGDLTCVCNPEVSEIVQAFRRTFGVIVPAAEKDPMHLLSWGVFNRIPIRVGFHAILDILYSDFLIVESLSHAKRVLQIDDLRGFKLNKSAAERHRMVETIDFSLDCGMYHVLNGVYRLRSCFDKLITLLAHSLHVQMKISKATSYSKKIDLLVSSAYVQSLVEPEATRFTEIMMLVSDISGLKRIRDHEAHIGSLSFEHGVMGYGAANDVPSVISTLFDGLDRFRAAFLKTLLLLTDLVEGGPVPENVAVVATSNSVYLFDTDTEKKYMTFALSARNALCSTPKDLTFKGGVLRVECEDGTCIEINFISDVVRRLRRGIPSIYKGDILSRNMEKGWCEELEK